MQLKEIEKLAASVMEKAVDAKEVAGVNLLVLKDKAPVLSLHAGYADLENKVLMEDDTIMRLYSMSKPVTAACMMILMQRGLVDLNDPVSKFIPAFANQTYVNGNTLSLVQRQMTVHDLLFMTSGLSYGSDSAAGKATSDLFAEMDTRLSTEDAMTTREFADRVGKNPLEFEPSSNFMYGVIITCFKIIDLTDNLLFFLLSPLFCVLISTVNFQITIHQRRWKRCQIQVFSFLRKSSLVFLRFMHAQKMD